MCFTNNSIKLLSFVYTQLNVKTVLFQTIQFSILNLFVHSLNVKQNYLTLSGATILRQSGDVSDDNEMLLHIPQSSIIAEG